MNLPAVGTCMLCTARSGAPAITGLPTYVSVTFHSPNSHCICSLAARYHHDVVHAWLCHHPSCALCTNGDCTSG